MFGALLGTGYALLGEISTGGFFALLALIGLVITIWSLHHEDHREVG
jgi:hypothetical protein